MNRYIWLSLALLAAAPVAAQQTFPRFEITPFAAYRIGGTFEDEETAQKYELDENSGYGITLNMLADANTQYEFTWSRQTTDLDLTQLEGINDKVGLDVDYYQLGGTYLLDGQLSRPYIVATLGAARYMPEPSDISSETYFAFSIGGGWKFFPTRRLGLRLEGRFYGTWLSGSSAIFCTSAPQNSGCLIQASGDILWQWEMSAGASFRF
jgi:hypothetical protein